MKPRLRRIALILVVIVAVIAVLGPIARDYVILHIAGWMAPPVGEPQEVTWATGETPPTLAGQKRPNIVVILADDLGYNDLSFGGGGVANGAVPTPNINAIAHDGVTLAQGYAGNATCAPSRAAILTGRFATRFGFEFTPVPKEFSKVISKFRNDMGHTGPNDPPVIYHSELEDQEPPMDDMGLPTSETTIAALLKSRGYHTIHLGKWHLGSAKRFQPLSVGFDESLGFYQAASMFLPEDDPNVVNSKQDFDPIDKFIWPNLPFGVVHNDGDYFRPKAYMTDYLADEAVKAIHANAKRPFFMYLAFNAVHTPLQALKSDYDALPQIKDHRMRVYAAMVKSLDRSVGKVTAALKEQGLEDNTLVIFTTDNGGAHYIGLPDINKPYRGWKATFFEGGIHVPFFMKWPNQLPKGVSYQRAAAHVDIFSTAAAAAGAAVPTDRVYDGVNLVPFIQGKDGGHPHDALYWRSGDYSTLLAGDWKLQSAEKPKKDWLFNLKNDPTEKVDLSAKDPDKLAELKALMAVKSKEMVKPLWPSLLQAPVKIDYPMGLPAPPGAEYVYWSN
ncbi:sulfatase-like hydrolase/transferase [Stenotrophobium rhamnosiphilum]|uniref:Sulfatase n=1 Tax=Stenotrophobium rhamnosiphilum TaxID=2029166 RepID=A0A2T5MKM7_9GAMM|nr:sulfatase-like hydrolase/transferase [Stenotrophobium rhamnosiphilum]PTU33131.1 sulfatase [Stenotrophobium rhamnosiphilum]